MKYIDIPNDTIDKLLYDTNTISTPFHNEIKVINADYTASGRPSPIVEHFISKNIYPYYSNTHSNSHNGIYMKNKINYTKSYLKKILNLNDDYIILFTGNGTTAAINHISNSIDYNKYDRVIIFLSIYEHYSNFLPWLKNKKIYNNIIIEYIPLIDEELDLKFLFYKLLYYYNYSYKYNTLVICSIIACSNVTGYILPLDNIIFILNKFNNHTNFNKYIFVDFACSAPYINIDCSKYDAVFFSPHKFIGGTSTPGILVSKKCLFMNNCPFIVGGGCVKKSNYENIIFDDNMETKESAGTPNIIGIIKLLKIFQIKHSFINIIQNNEHIINNIISKKIKYFITTYPNFKIILYPFNKNKLPIIAFSIDNLHYNLIVKLLNDIYGIQTRGGINCCGLLANHIKKIFNIDGWCRVTFHWTMKYNTIIYILNAIEYIIINGHKYINKYHYNNNTNLFEFY